MSDPQRPTTGSFREAAATDAAEKAMELLKLMAQDEEDLRIISAHMQDAVVRVGDICWMPKKGRFALLANRFEWLSHMRGEHDAPMQARTGLHFEHVLAVRSRNIRQDAENGVLELLAIAFHPAREEEAGHIDLIFAGDGVIRLEVECIQAWMEDLGECWQAGCLPCHDDETG